MPPLLLASACTGSDDAAATASPALAEVAWGACEFEVPAGVEIDCGTLAVPVDRADHDSGSVQLAFGVVRRDAAGRADDPIAYLSGGPGQSTLELVPQALGEAL